MHPRFNRTCNFAAAPAAKPLFARDIVRELDKDTPNPQEQGIEFLIERALTYHPNITRKTWETRVIWDRSLKKAAGQFRSRERVILLHPGLKLAHKFQYVETFLHELAHAMQWYAYAKADHGPTWYEMMHILAQKPKRLHNIPECMDRVDVIKVMKVADEFKL